MPLQGRVQIALYHHVCVRQAAPVPYQHWTIPQQNLLLHQRAENKSCSSIVNEVVEKPGKMYSNKSGQGGTTAVPKASHDTAHVAAAAPHISVKAKLGIL